MKHTYFFLLIFFVAACLSGQNYRTASTGSYNFYAASDQSTPGKTGFETLHFDSSAVAGSDTIYYPLRSFMSEMDNNGCYVVNDTGWTGSKMLRQITNNEVYFSMSNDSIFIRNSANAGQSWHLFELGGGDYIEASVSTNSQQTLVTGTDSCKVITLQAKNSSGSSIAHVFNNKTIVLGRNSGFVRCYRWRDFPSDTVSLNLAGSDMPATGVQNLTARQIFDYSVGDIFDYKYEWNGMSSGSSVHYTRKEVMTKYTSLNNDSLFYSFARKVYAKNYTYTPTFDSTITTTIDTVNEIIVASECKILNGVAVQFNIDSNGNFGGWEIAGTMEEQFVNPSEYNGRMQKVAYPNYSLSNYPCIMDFGGGWCAWHYQYFAEGLGLTEKKDMTGGPNPATCGHTLMVYYSKGTETYGTPVDWGLLLGTETYSFNQQIKMYPNPANDILFVQNATAGSKFEIFDLSGKKILQQSIRQNVQEIDVTSLVPGIYFYRCEGSAGKFTIQR